MAARRRATVRRGLAAAGLVLEVAAVVVGVGRTSSRLTDRREIVAEVFQVAAVGVERVLRQPALGGEEQEKVSHLGNGAAGFEGERVGVPGVRPAGYPWWEIIRPRRSRARPAAAPRRR